jgi:hypothetical protein
VQIGVISEFAQGVTVGCGLCEWVAAHARSRGFGFRIAPFGGLARRRCDRPIALRKLRVRVEALDKRTISQPD